MDMKRIMSIAHPVTKTKSDVEPLRRRQSSTRTTVCGRLAKQNRRDGPTDGLIDSVAIMNARRMIFDHTDVIKPPRLCIEDAETVIRRRPVHTGRMTSYDVWTSYDVATSYDVIGVDVRRSEAAALPSVWTTSIRMPPPLAERRSA